MWGASAGFGAVAGRRCRHLRRADTSARASRIASTWTAVLKDIGCVASPCKRSSCCPASSSFFLPRTSSAISRPSSRCLGDRIAVTARFYARRFLQPIKRDPCGNLGDTFSETEASAEAARLSVSLRILSSGSATKGQFALSASAYSPHRVGPSAVDFCRSI